MVDARRPVRPILRRRAARRRPGPGSPRTHGTAGCPWADVDARPHFGRYGHGLIGSTEIIAYSWLIPALQLPTTCGQVAVLR